MAEHEARALQIRVCEDSDFDAVVTLWTRCNMHAPHNEPRTMFDRKRAFQPELFLVGEVDGGVAASVMAGYEGRRGWINLLAVDPEYRRHGFGRAMMEAAHARLAALGCPKVNLQIRVGNSAAFAFYERLGYKMDLCYSLGRFVEPVEEK
jgi:ribosomal protein S18 acetylase RimI-like enzyme